ncbi:hypothetical protein EB73_15345, partial [Mycobacterium sp. SWH-M3]
PLTPTLPTYTNNLTGSTAQPDRYLSGDHDTNPIPWDTPAPVDNEPAQPDAVEPAEPEPAECAQPEPTGSAECADAAEPMDTAELADSTEPPDSAEPAEHAAESMDTTELAECGEPPDSADPAEPAAEPPDSAEPAEHAAEPMDGAVPAEHAAEPPDSADPTEHAAEPMDSAAPAERTVTPTGSAEHTVEPAELAEPDATADAAASADVIEPASSSASPVDKPVPPAWSPGTAVVVDGGVIPTPLLADLIAAGATVKHLNPPGAEPEPRYRPSAKLAAWVRMRDMTCMFPGCDRPAERCDVDHTEPYPGGPTHPSNTKCLCRIHHLLKVRREARVFRMGVRDPDPRVIAVI